MNDLKEPFTMRKYLQKESFPGRYSSLLLLPLAA